MKTLLVIINDDDSRAVIMEFKGFIRFIKGDIYVDKENKSLEIFGNVVISSTQATYYLRPLS